MHQNCKKLSYLFLRPEFISVRFILFFLNLPNLFNYLTEVANSSSNSHPMRYLFLLGVLPTTFGSLYSLGYTPLQIMVIGAYIGLKLVLISSSQNLRLSHPLLIFTWFLKSQVWKIKLFFKLDLLKIKCRSIGSQVKMKPVPNVVHINATTLVWLLKVWVPESNKSFWPPL